ncbi:porin [Paraburkholderia sartisoli]|uniref:Outer membrane protein (Porin) n=1 Tax=Paraburkholderia sartisoli TaxID=83784 RepID=A0A1H4EIA6_9BURK|nr:porin [Paraburkholderia sartisoli]SEA84569.1 Outer membrane protein (porin) [Paraburkholderia sartisoli]
MGFKSGSLALLIAFAPAAYGQSSVTLYGVLDSGLLYQSTAAASFAPNARNLGHTWQVKDGGIFSSLWGLKGSEDIGGGYKINFRLQGSFTSTNGKPGLSDTPGATALFNQYTSIGISGPFGTIDAGRQIVPMIYAMAETDARGAQYFGSILTAWLGLNQAAGWPGTSTNAPIGALYDSNALVYTSPKFHGASVSLEFAPGGVPGQLQGGTRESAVFRYSNYGLNLAALYYNGHDTNPYPASYPTGSAVPATGLANNRFYYFGAMYTISGFSLSASYSVGKNPAKSNSVDFEMVSGGLGYQFNPFFKVTSGYYYLRDRNHSANHSSEIAVGGEYNLSKATRAYVQVGYVDNKGTMNQTIVYGTPVAPGVSTTAAMVGIRHNF